MEVDSPDIDAKMAAVLERAHRTIAERRLADATRTVSRDRPWQIICIVLLFVLISGTFLWPTGTLVERLRVIVRGICDQQHNLTLGGSVLPLDARCTGIYTGLLLTLVWLLLRQRLGTATLPHGPVLVGSGLAILGIGVDGMNSFMTESTRFSLYMLHNALRLATGLCAGLALAIVGMPVFNRIMRVPAHSNRQVVSTSGETLGIIALIVLVGGLLWRGPTWLFAPLAVFSVLGALIALFLMNLFLVALLSGLRHRVMLLGQLAQPAALGIIITVVELLVLALVRGTPALVGI